jgi:hypothetical protein
MGRGRQQVSAPSLRERILSWTPVRVRRRWFYLRAHRRWLRLCRPVTFTEKINWRIIKDRRQILEGTCDKLAMKSFASEHGGDLPLRVPETYWSGTDIGELADVALPGTWVLKPNHRFGMVVLGSGAPDVTDLRVRTAGWLDEWNWTVLGEWAYKHARRLIIAEERIGGGAQPPTDYKVFVFDGVARLVALNHDRFTNFSLRYYTPEWEALAHRSLAPLAAEQRRPAELPLVLEIAERLGRPFDFMRVDLYVEDGEVWFGELTPYSAGGLQTYDPPDLDATLGGFWQLPKLAR